MMLDMWDDRRLARGARPARRPATTRIPAAALRAAGGVLVAGGLSLALLGTPASAQWIGSPGGGAIEVAPAPSGTTGNAPGPALTPSPGLAPAQGNPPTSITIAPVDPGTGAAGLSGSAMGGAAGGMSPGFAAPQPQQGPSQADVEDCRTNIDKLRGAIEKNGGALQGATKKKLPPDKVCPMFRSFVDSQQKFLTYLRANKTKCGVPDEVLTKLKENTTQVSGVRDKVCQIAANGPPPGAGGPPPQGSVASGLGLSSGLPGASANKQGGVFDTLGGSALR